MFQNWGFLLGEIWLLLLLAALLGLLCGWLIWGGKCKYCGGTGQIGSRDGFGDGSARGGLGAAAAGAGVGAAAGAASASSVAQATSRQSEVFASDADAGAGDAAASADSSGDAAGGDTGDVDYDGDGVIEGKDEGTRPEALSGPRGGKADDLKRIKGIGAKLEKLCNDLGFYHFDQIANWTKDEIAWVDSNLEGFKGRVSRDKWVAQAKTLAEGGETEFSKRVDKGDVY